LTFLKIKICRIPSWPFIFPENSTVLQHFPTEGHRFAIRVVNLPRRLSTYSGRVHTKNCRIPSVHFPSTISKNLLASVEKTKLINSVIHYTLMLLNLWKRTDFQVSTNSTSSEGRALRPGSTNHSSGIGNKKKHWMNDGIVAGLLSIIRICRSSSEFQWHISQWR